MGTIYAHAATKKVVCETDGATVQPPIHYEGGFSERAVPAQGRLALAANRVVTLLRRCGKTNAPPGQTWPTHYETTHVSHMILGRLLLPHCLATCLGP